MIRKIIKMIRTYITTALLLMLSAMTCMAEDAVYLRNGSVIKGKIEEYAIKGDSVNIKTERGILNLSMSEVSRLEVGDESISYYTVVPAKKSKYRWMAEFHAGWEFAMNKSRMAYSVGLTTTHGIEVIPHLFVGGGTGVVYNGVAAVIPFFGEVRTYAGGKKVAFTSGLREGGGLAIGGGRFDSIYYAHLDLGVRFAIKESLYLSVSPYVDFYSVASFGLKVAVGTF